MSKRKISPGAGEHKRTDKMMQLAASFLGQHIGYLRVESLPGSAIFNRLPTRSVDANKMVRLQNELAVVKQGLVEIRHVAYDKLVTSLSPGTLFGEMPLLSQSMFGTSAVAGPSGVTLAIMDANQTRKWAKQNSLALLELIGSRLIRVEDDHYRSRFYLTDSRLAAFLLELAGNGTSITGITHREIGERIGIYRETVTNGLNAMKGKGLIKIGRANITILDKKALRALSDL
jgi:CRP-like cAMP-binding protein